MEILCECLGCLLDSRQRKSTSEYRKDVRDYVLNMISTCACGACEVPYERIVSTGTYKDIIVMFSGTSLEGSMLSYYASILVNDNEKLTNNNKNISTAAKWAPTEGHAFDKKFKLASKLAEKLGISKAQYRKMLVKLRSQLDLVETKMSSGLWSTIDYKKLPSNVIDKYARSFEFHDGARFTLWRENLMIRN